LTCFGGHVPPVGKARFFELLHSLVRILIPGGRQPSLRSSFPTMTEAYARLGAIPPYSYYTVIPDL
jgi:hypothetical protein